MLLLDTDYIAYKSAQACEEGIDFGDDVIITQSNFSEVLKVFGRELRKITTAMMDDEVMLYFSSPKNFRKEIYPNYKGHRNRRKPLGYARLVNWCKENFATVIRDDLEADDALGIDATCHQLETQPILVSPDKDMRQIPGHVFTMEETLHITPEKGAKWHLIQTLAGDQTDGYSGVPGIGIKRAVALFEEDGYSWETVVKAFAKKELGEEVALMNASKAPQLTG